MYEKMTMREWSTNTTPTSTTAPGLLSLAEPVSNGESIVSSNQFIFTKTITSLVLILVFRYLNG